MRKNFQKFINIILDYPKWIISLVSIITIIMILLASRLEMNFSIEELFALNDPDVEKYFDFLEEFDREDNLILLMYECDDPFSYDNLFINKIVFIYIYWISSIFFSRWFGKITRQLLSCTKKILRRATPNSVSLMES